VSATQEQPIVLNEQQVAAIIAKAKAERMYEGEPTDAEAALKDASTLVWHARRAYENGNRSDVVTELMFIADVDQNPPIAQAPQQGGIVGGDLFPAPAQQQAPQNGGEHAQYSNEQLQQMIDGLAPNSGVPAVKAEIEKLTAELQRRNGASQEVAPPAPQAAAAPPQQAPAPMPVPPVLPEGSVDAQGQPRQLAEAPAQTGAEGFAPPAQAPSPDERRAGLEGQLTGQILLAYGKSFGEVGSIPTDDLERMIAYPGGPVAESRVSPERDALEGLITGPLLKAHGKGRKQIVDMSDEELRWMIEHPDGTRWPGPAVGNAPSAEAPPIVAETPVVPVAAAPPVAPTPVPPAVAQPTVTPAPAPTTVSTVTCEFDGDTMFPEIEKPPVLPFDISRTSDEELRAIHGQFHAVLARANWVISNHQDGIDDLKRALVAREVEVRNALPAKIDGKNVTKDQAASLVEADEDVVRIKDQILQAQKPLRKLEVIADNSRGTYARCSREYAMRHGEETGRSTS